MAYKVCGENTDKGCKERYPATFDYFKPGYPDLYYLCAKCSPKSRSSYKYADRNTRLILEYGITQCEYKDMYETQEGKCRICGKNQPTLCVDHNHTTGKVRGLLCQRCNLMLGIIEENTPLNIDTKISNIVTYMRGV